MLAVMALMVGIATVVSTAGVSKAAASPPRPSVVPWSPARFSTVPPMLRSAAPRVVRRDTDLHLDGLSSDMTSQNWSGYVATGTQYTGVSGGWTVPSVQPSEAEGVSESWIGIGGPAGQSALIQTGTTQETSYDRTTYFAWYELYPAAPIDLGAVSPGDQMSATINETSPGMWAFTIQDLTSTQQFTGSGPFTTTIVSAEWIEEAPTNGETGQVDLANFGSVPFTDTRISGANLADQDNEPWEMVDVSGNVIAYPSAYDLAGGFTITYGSPPTSVTTTTLTFPPETTTLPPLTAPTTRPPPRLPVVCPTPTNHAEAGRPVGLAAMRRVNGCTAYWVVTEQGQVIGFGGATTYGDLSSVPHDPVIAIAATPDSAGYWLVTSTGQVYPFGDAGHFGDLSGHHLNDPIVAVAVTPDGLGYWLVGGDGGIFTFGDARFYGSTGDLRLNEPIVGIATGPIGAGYWLVASDGGIFTFGRTLYLGSMGSTRLNRPVVGITAGTPGPGYRMVGSDGGIFSFAAPFYGSLGAHPPASPIIAMSPSVDGNGYYMLGADGTVYNFGDAPNLGSVAVALPA